MTQFKDKSPAAAATARRWGCSPTRSCRRPTSCSTSADQVPVGEDQRQHLELTRDLAQRFNSRFGDTFVVPEPLHPQGDREDLRPADRRQADEQEHRRQRRASGCSTTRRSIEKKIKSAVTDTGREIRFDPVGKPGVSNLLAILSAFGGEPVPTTSSERFAGARLRRPEEGGRRGRARLRRAVPGAGARLPRRPGRARRACSPAAPSGPARSPAATLADGLRPGRASCPAAAAVTARERRAPIGVAIADPGAATAASCSGSASRSATRWRASIPTHITLLPPHRGRRRRPRPRSRSTCARSPSPSSRSRSTCAAPGPSTRCRRSSSCRWCSGISDCERVEVAGALRSAGARARVPLPPARHGRPRPARRRARSGPSTRWPTTTCASRSGASASTSTARTGCGGRSATSRSGSTLPGPQQRVADRG